MPFDYTRNQLGQVAQLVEQWTENPCVAGSIPALTTAFNSRRDLALAPAERSVLRLLLSKASGLACWLP